MKELNVSDIRPGEKITGYFALRKSDLREHDGKYRLALELGDATGRVAAVMWDVTPMDGELYKTGKIVKIRGIASTWQEQLQVRVDKMRLAEAEEYELGDFFRKSRFSREELEARLNEMIERIENEYLKKLLDKIFGDEKLRDKFLTWPAGKLLHHDIIGGLAEHSLSMAEVTVRLADHYPQLDRDLIIVGTLLHDIGKIWELDIGAMYDYSDVGRLVGHINMGDHFVTMLAREIEHFPDDLLMHVRHMILAHQGEREFGSPIVPQTPEALFLHLVDMLDSRMGAIEKIRERTGDAGWSEYSRTFNRFFYFGEGDDIEEEEEDKE